MQQKKILILKKEFAPLSRQQKDSVRVFGVLSFLLKVN
jgi:hypothetical protein